MKSQPKKWFELAVRRPVNQVRSLATYQDTPPAALATVRGNGDYFLDTRRNITEGTAVPVFRNGQDTVLMHREFIADIQGSPSFENSLYGVNPGVPGTFPWLSQIAAQYEEYEFLGLLFEYVPTSSAIGSSTNPSLGSVMMATNYDAADEPFASKQEIDSYQFANSGPPFQRILHTVECAKASNTMNKYFVRNSSGIRAGSSIQMYDLGNFQICTQGMQANYTVGELWVTYKVKLSRPRVKTNFFGRLWCNNDIEPVTANYPLTGNLPVAQTRGGIPPSTYNSLSFQGAEKFLVINHSGVDRFCFPTIGHYKVTCYWTQGLSITSPPSYSVGDQQFITIGTSSNKFSNATTASTMLYVKVHKSTLFDGTEWDVRGTITITGLATMASNAIVQVECVEVPDSVCPSWTLVSL